jgi:hypothetical protein
MHNEATSLPDLRPDLRPDVLVANAGTVFTICPLTARAKAWIDDNVASESYQWLGGTLGVEHRYASALTEGMLSNGLVLR